MHEYYPVYCPSCGWKGSSEDSIVHYYVDDTSDPICPNCCNHENGTYVYLLDDCELVTGESDVA